MYCVRNVGNTEMYDGEEFIPMLCEMFSRTLVFSAEKHFETINPKTKSNLKKLPYFSKEYKDAHAEHKSVFAEWRKSGRPSDSKHPAKEAVLQSRRHLQKVARTEESMKSMKQNDDLMDTFHNNPSQIYDKLKKTRGVQVKRIEIPFIETLSGKYTGENILEGFAANTEILCSENDDKTEFDNEAYSMFIKDNMIIMDITSDEKVAIPQMNLIQLKDILFKKLKVNKACDVFKLTVEHLRNAGDESLLLILLNNIILHINVLSSPELNTSVASVIYKGKDKPVFQHKSHRLVRVTPLFARIIDEYMRPALIDLVMPMQNCNQYGFTEKVSYMLGALQRHEVEKHCVDMKKTFFGVSLDGGSAFEVVNRQIQTRELYCAGEVGQYWQASHSSYQNSQTCIKMNGKLSRKFTEIKGVKQGRNKSSDHYKVYIAPLLDTLDKANLGVWIGNVCVSVSAVADDVYPMSDNQSKLQALLDIAEQYGNMYRIEYGATKTKVTVVGSEVDMNYFEEVTPWKMSNDSVKGPKNNEHLGQIVSVRRQEEKKLDLRLEKGRKSLFGFLGAGFAFKCSLSPSSELTHVQF